MSLPDWSYVIAGLDPAISPAQGIPASGRGNDIVSYKSKLELTRILYFFKHPQFYLLNKPVINTKKILSKTKPS